MTPGRDRLAYGAVGLGILAAVLLIRWMPPIPAAKAIPHPILAAPDMGGPVPDATGMSSVRPTAMEGPVPDATGMSSVRPTAMEGPVPDATGMSSVRPPHGEEHSVPALSRPEPIRRYVRVDPVKPMVKIPDRTRHTVRDPILDRPLSAALNRQPAVPADTDTRAAMPVSAPVDTTPAVEPAPVRRSTATAPVMILPTQPQTGATLVGPGKAAGRDAGVHRPADLHAKISDPAAFRVGLLGVAQQYQAAVSFEGSEIFFRVKDRQTGGLKADISKVILGNLSETGSIFRIRIITP